MEEMVEAARTVSEGESESFEYKISSLWRKLTQRTTNSWRVLDLEGSRKGVFESKTRAAPVTGADLSTVCKKSQSNKNE
jgi:hypothetical protein